MVPRLRICGCAICGSASPSSGKSPRQAGVALHLMVTGQRADARAAAAVGADAGELVDSVDVDQDRRPGQPEIHRRDQALATGQKLGLVAMLGLERERLRQRGCRDVFERGRLHGARWTGSGCGAFVRRRRAAKYEAAAPQVKNRSLFRPSEFPIGAVLAPMMVLPMIVSACANIERDINCVA